MNFVLDGKTIIAPITGDTNSVSAVTIIRISGFQSLEYFIDILTIDIKKIKARKSHLTFLKCKGIKFDQVLVVFFPGPNSFTGENVLEVHVHGNPLNVRRVMQEFLDLPNIRLALPGEFTFRAYKNKRMNLSQVEGLNQFYKAQTPLALSQAMNTLLGHLQKDFQDLFNLYNKFKMAIELSIDFSEDIGEEESLKQIKDNFIDFDKFVKKLSTRCIGDLNSENLSRICLVGPTNAGKSTLFNLFLKKRRSIVSEVEGTTRDYVSEIFYVKKEPFTIIDTAGLRDTSDEIEAQGIEQSQNLIRESFFKILVLSLNSLGEMKFKCIDKEITYDLVVFTHADLTVDMDHIFNLAGLKFIDYKIIGKNNLGELNIYKFNTLPFTVERKSCFKEIVYPLSGSIGPGKTSGSIGPDKTSGSIGPGKTSGSIGPDKTCGSIGPDKTSGSIGPGKTNGPIGPTEMIATSEKFNQLGHSSPDSDDEITNLLHGLIDKKFKDLRAQEPISSSRHQHILKKLNGECSIVKQIVFSEKFDPAILTVELFEVEECVGQLIGNLPSDELLSSIFDNFCIGK